VSNLVGEFGFLDAGEDLGKVFVSVRGFVDGIFTAVAEDIVLVEFLVDSALIELTAGGFSAESSASSVVHGVAAFFSSGECCHDDRSIAWIPRKEDGMSSFVERGFLEGVVTAGEGTSSALSVNPLRNAIYDFFTSNVMADEINEVSLSSGEDFLKGLQDELVDQKMVHGGEVGTECHVVEISIAFGSSERCVDEFLISGGIGDVPFIEVGLEGFELSLGEVVSKSARSAVREEGYLAILESENFCGSLSGGSLLHCDFFGFSEMVSPSVGAELLSLAEKAVVIAITKHFCETFFESRNAPVVAEVRGVFASVCPLGRNPEGLANFWSRSLGHGFFAEFEVYVSSFGGVSLSSACPGGSAFADGIDESTSDTLVGDGVVINVELKQ